MAVAGAAAILARIDPRREFLDDYVPVAIQHEMSERTKAWRKILQRDESGKKEWMGTEP